MSSTRRRRIRARQDQLRAERVHRRRQADAKVARIQEFDDALPKVMAWIAIATLIAVVITAVVA